MKNDSDIDSEDLEISFDEIGEYSFSPGEIFIKKSSGKVIKLFHAGQTITSDIIEKYRPLGDKISVSKVINHKNIADGIEVWNQYRFCANEIERVAIRKKVLAWFSDTYWKGNKNGNVLDLVFISDSIFIEKSDEIEKYFELVSDDIKIRSILAGHFAVVFSLAMGITDWTMLQDIFQILVLMDVEIGSTLTFESLEHLEKVRKSPQDGYDEFFKNGLPFETKAFENHISHEKLRDDSWQNKYFKDKTLREYIGIHHEFLKGQSKTNGKGEGKLTDLESIIIVCCNLFPYIDIEFKNNDGIGFLKKYFESNDANHSYFLSIRLQKMLTKVFEECLTAEELEEQREVS